MRSEEELQRYYASAYYSGQNEDKIARMFPRFGFRVAMARAFQPTHKRERFFASAKHGSALKRAIKAAVLAGVYGASVAVPPWGGHMKAALLKR